MLFVDLSNLVCVHVCVDSFPSLEGHLDSLFKIVHVGPLATGVQALHLLFLVMEASKTVSARYYRALYHKLLDPQLGVRSAQQVR